MVRLRTIIAALFIAAFPVVAMSATPVGSMVSGYDYTNNKAKVPFVNSAGALSVFGAAAGGSVFGVDNQGVTPSVAPLTVACVFANPTVTAGQVVRIQCDANGHPIVSINGGTIASTQSGTWTVQQGTPPWSVSQSGAWFVGQTGTWTVQPGNTANTTAWLFTGNFTGADASALTNALKTYDLQGLYNGTTEDLARSVQGASGSTGLGVAAISAIPNASANVAIVPVVSSAAESGHVLKASAGNLYRLRVTTSAQNGYVLIFNATTVPADGAVTPQSCTAVGSNGTTEIDHALAPDRYSTGISVAFSSTGCFVKTASATVMFEGMIQ